MSRRLLVRLTTGQIDVLRRAIWRWIQTADIDHPPASTERALRAAVDAFDSPIPAPSLDALRGIGNALAHLEADIEGEAGRADEFRQLAAADNWYRAACREAGWERVYPHLKAQPPGHDEATRPTRGTPADEGAWAVAGDDAARRR